MKESGKNKIRLAIIMPLARSLKEREEWNSQDHTEEFKKKLKNGCLDYKEKPIKI